MDKCYFPKTSYLIFELHPSPKIAITYVTLKQMETFHCLSPWGCVKVTIKCLTRRTASFRPCRRPSARSCTGGICRSRRSCPGSPDTSYSRSQPPAYVDSQPGPRQTNLKYLTQVPAKISHRECFLDAIQRVDTQSRARP